MTTKAIFKKTEKAFIANLPRFTFPGRIVVIQSEAEAERAVEYLSQSDIIGFDTETRPSFHKGTPHKVALLQLSTRKVCFLFRLCFIGMPPGIVRLLSDASLLKVGLSLKDDFLMLQHRQAFTPGGFVELQNYATTMGTEDKSLQKLFANLFHQRISKGARLSNWEADVLSESQKVYAATDAYTCIMLYDEMIRLLHTNEYTITENPINA